MLRGLTCALILTVATAARADVQLLAVCGDNMVLQRNSCTHISGKASAGERVTVTFRDQTVSTTADEKGAWRVPIETRDAATSLEMTVAGNNTIQLHNIAVGEVWLCAGQSNMEARIAPEEDLKLVKSDAPNPNLRIFTAGSKPGPVDDLFGMWADARPGNVEWMSTVAYFFGRDLQADLGVPVGLIVTASGGTAAESWIPWPVIEKHPVLKQPWSNGLAQCYSLLIQPLRQYTIRGAVWYQGESNTRNAFRYRVLLPTLIQSWRDQWQLGDFPFLIVQLPGWKEVGAEPRDSAWAELRESQQLALAVPNTALAVTTDCGDEWDIHPLPKHPIGSRLAQIARGKFYGESIEWSGPVLDKVIIDGPRAVLSFTHADGGLVAKKMVEHRRQVSGETRASAWRVAPDSPEGAELLGFAVCGEDKQFHKAQATIEGQRVVVTCDAVPQPVAVRYGWAAYPLCNLYNRAGLPASPFRTDDFPCITREEKAHGLAEN